MTVEKSGSPSDNFSWMWGGLEVGHAIHAPYHQGAWRSYHRVLLNAMWNKQEFCIIPSIHSSYSGLLAPTNPAGTTLRMASGVALVDGFLYTNDGNVDFALATAGYYRLVLRRDWDEKIVRATVLGPSTVGYPTPRYDTEPQNKGNYIDVPLAKIYSSGATLSIIDERTFFRNITTTKRQGGSIRIYGFPGTTAYVVDNLSIQLGIFEPTGVTGSIDFPEFYQTLIGDVHGNEPIIFAQGFSSIQPSAARLTVALGAVFSSYDFDWAVDNATNLQKIMWMSIGGVCVKMAPV